MARKTAAAPKPKAKLEATKKPGRKAATKKGRKTAAKKGPKKPIKKQAPRRKAKGDAVSDRSGRSVLHALLIGSDFYFPNTLPEGSYGSLRGCVRDVERVEEFLRRRGGLTADRLVKLTSSHGHGDRPAEPKQRWPTYENIVNSFRAVIDRAKPEDHVYVHYSGHGGQCKTIVPKIKGPNGLDETLVPIDIGDSSARYVRDVEIAKLLKDMKAKGLLVTLVLDNCHSGGATRGTLAITSAPQDGPIAVRGVNFVDSTPRPTESLVASLAELGRPMSATRSTTRAMVAAADDDRCVVLAACSPNELASEFAFDGINRQGALTYWYLDSVGKADSDLTFRTVFGRVLHQIHGQFPAQTPVLFGDPDRASLGATAKPVAASVPISKVATGGKSVTLPTGQAGLVRAGAEFAVYSAGSGDLTDPSGRIAIVRAASVQATETTADVTETFGARKIKVGDRAVMVGVPQKLVRTVQVERFDGKPPTSKDAALVKVTKSAPGKGWWRLSDGSDSLADLVVSTTKDGSVYEICDSGGTPLQVRPELKTNDAGSVSELAERLTHLARYQVVRDLDNANRSSPLQGKLAVSLLKAPRGFDAGKPLPAVGLDPYPVGAVPTVQLGDWLVLAVENRSSKTVNAVAVDLGPDWSVSVVHPDEQFHPLGPGEKWLLPLCSGLPEGIEGGLDVLKVIATVGPPPPFEMLALPQLDKPVRRSVRGTGVRAAVRAASDPLSDLFDLVTSERTPTRNMISISGATGDWVVSQVEVRTKV
jgi:hypothetical protein